MRSIIVAAFVFTLSTATSSRAAGKASPTAAAEKCAHGVKKTVCTRCNPKLIPVFKSHGDWCGEHGVPESQCARCNPKLAKEGLK